MVSHCDSGCCATWFAGWEKALESAETIPTAQKMPISHRASFISAPTWRVSYRATDSWLIMTQGNRGRAGYSIFDLGALQGGSASVPIPKFARLRGDLWCELRNLRDTSVPIPKFASIRRGL